MPSRGAGGGSGGGGGALVIESLTITDTNTVSPLSNIPNDPTQVILAPLGQIRDPSEYSVDSLGNVTWTSSELVLTTEMKLYAIYEKQV